MLFKLRPFARISIGQGNPTEFRGTIEDLAFVVYVGSEGLDIPYRLRTAQIGADERGPFALVKEQELDLLNDVVLRVAPEFGDEELGEGEMLKIGHEIAFEQRYPRQFFDGIGAAVGSSTEQANLVAMLREHVSISFTRDGRIAGHA